MWLYTPFGIKILPLVQNKCSTTTSNFKILINRLQWSLKLELQSELMIQSLPIVAPSSYIWPLYLLSHWCSDANRIILLPHCNFSFSFPPSCLIHFNSKFPLVLPYRAICTLSMAIYIALPVTSFLYLSYHFLPSLFQCMVFSNTISSPFPLLPSFN